MQIVPLSAVPSQNFAATLGGQAVEVSLYVLGAGLAQAMYMDLIAGGEPIYTARIVRAYSGLPDNAPPFMLVGARYLGFEGDFLFLDTQATATNPAEDPEPAGLGARWQLMYFSLADLQAAGLVAIPTPPPVIVSLGITTLGGVQITTESGAPIVTGGGYG